MTDVAGIDLAPAQFAIGEPGRAGLEVKTGPCPSRHGPADIELSTAEAGGAVVQGASVRGVLHRHTGEVRQDAFASQAFGDNQWVAVVCDGVGSLGRSDEASNLVAWRLAELHALGSSLTEALTLVNGELRELADIYRSDPDATTPDAERMATTVVAISAGLQDGRWLGELCWVGDSEAWHLSPDGEWTLLNDDGEDDADEEIHSTSVRPLPKSSNTFDVVPLCIEGGALFVMSDGVSKPLKWSDDVKQQLATWWSTPPELLTFGAQVSFPRRGHMDDRTVVGLWPTPSSSPPTAGDE